METEYVKPPNITKKTLELGSRHSPDYVCAPFKYILGNYIETIEAGANILVQTGGVCRLGYYGELDEQILSDLGYDIRFVNFAKTGSLKAVNYYNHFKDINPDVSLNKIASILPVILQMVVYMDEAEDFIRKNIGFETETGSFESTHNDFLTELRTVRDKKELNNTYQKYLKNLKKSKLISPKIHSGLE